MRDAIVRPLEDQLAGAPNLDHLETAIQPGQASIVAVFQLSSDPNDDLVQVQGRVQNAQRSLPNDISAPQIALYNPSEAVVVSLALRARALSAGDLSSLAINKIVPSLEQVPGVSFVQVNGSVTPSIQIDVDPGKLSASGFTLTDVISTITNNNIRAPGGILYAPNRETNLDVRGDIQNVPTVANLLLGSSASTPSPGSSISAMWQTSATRMKRSASTPIRAVIRRSHSTSKNLPAHRKWSPRTRYSPRCRNCAEPIPTSNSRCSTCNRRTPSSN
jgi:multidrug efflux pump subunit AcrB